MTGLREGGNMTGRFVCNRRSETQSPAASAGSPKVRPSAKESS